MPLPQLRPRPGLSKHVGLVGLLLTLAASAAAQPIGNYAGTWIQQTAYPLSGGFLNNSAAAITTGPDGALWFTEPRNRIGRITTAGVLTEYALPNANSWATAITTGPDGALWFTEAQATIPPGASQIGRITTSGVITEYPVATDNNPLGGITTGPDGALWFIEKCCNIGRITTSGAVTEYPVSGYLNGITTGPDGALWFTNNGSPTGICQIGRMTTAGILTMVSPAPCVPNAITTGPDGALWYTYTTLQLPPFSYEQSCVGSITTAGAV